MKGSKFKTELCSNDMTFNECELAILRHAVDETEKISGIKQVNNEDVKKMLVIVEEFIIKHKLVCYGGTAINNILPKYAQFYNRDIEIPDYDFYSPNALEHAKELADIFYKAGYKDVEAKAGIHYGTFKVFVNFIPIADITYLVPRIYNIIQQESIKIANIRYAPPDFLRMSMYLELSRPAGDVSRWEKVMKRSILLNKYYPMKLDKDCARIDFYGKADKSKKSHKKTQKEESPQNVNSVLREALIDIGVIFFGGYSTQLYSKYMSDDKRELVNKIPDFDVLNEEPNKCAMILKERLSKINVTNVELVDHKPIGELIPEHVELKVNGKSMVYIYKPIACHSYNKINIKGASINVATIDTVLAFYLSFVYADMPEYDTDRLMCIVMFLFDVEKRNRLAQKGILKRFSIDCYGKQNTLSDYRSKKTEMYKKLADKPGSDEYQMWFLKYIPHRIESIQQKRKEKRAKTQSKSKKIAEGSQTKKKGNRLLSLLRKTRKQYFEV